MDEFRDVRRATDEHRAAHRCWAYPYEQGPLLGLVSAMVGPQRAVELGTALGYTALVLAGGTDSTVVDTVERDPEHVRLARENIAAAGLDDRIVVHEGDGRTVLAELPAGEYDLAFFDAYAPELDQLNALKRLLRIGGTLVSANQTLSSDEEYLNALRRPPWRTEILGETAISVLMARGDAT